VQIAGADPQMMADAARYNVTARGAGSSTSTWAARLKKSCNVAAGSALLARDEQLVKKILDSVVAAVESTGDAQNPDRLGRAQQECSASGKNSGNPAASSAISVHGRTRACRFCRQCRNTTRSPR